MKKAEDKPRWFFVDEAGDPNFYGKGKKVIVGDKGCSRTFLVGFLRTYNPEGIRGRLAEVRDEVRVSKYLCSIPSVSKSIVAFHAKNDCPEVRKMVFEALESLEFAAQVVVGRKHEQRFRTTHKGSQDYFYDDLISRLFQRQLHLAAENAIVFSRRGNKTRQHALRSAVELGAKRFRDRYKGADITRTSVETADPTQDSALQAVDYVLWAIQRSFEMREMRYFNFVRPKIEMLWDIFDVPKLRACGKTVYDRKKNPFEIEKASPLS